MEKKPTKKIIGQASGAAGAGVIVAFLWNIILPNHQMPAEVAASLGGLLGPVIAYAVSWVPRPENGE